MWCAGLSIKPPGQNTICHTSFLCTRYVERLWSGPSLAGRIGSEVRVSASFQKIPTGLCRTAEKKDDRPTTKGVCPGGWLPIGCRKFLSTQVSISFQLAAHDTTTTTLQNTRHLYPEINPLMPILITSAEQRTIILQYNDWYTGRWWVGCTECNSPPVNVPTSYKLMWHYNCLWTLKC